MIYVNNKIKFIDLTVENTEAGDLQTLAHRIDSSPVRFRTGRGEIRSKACSLLCAHNRIQPNFQPLAGMW